MKTLKILLTALFLAAGSSQLIAVEYGGEKSFLYEIPFKACAVAPLPDEAKEKGIKVINTKEAKKLHDEGALFYDARDQELYQKGHIKDAKLVRFNQSKASYTIEGLPKNMTQVLVFYCYGESCAASYEAALGAKEFGFKEVYWYAAGYDGWSSKNHPVGK